MDTNVQRTTTSGFKHSDYKIGWICALYIELSATIAMLDTRHDRLPKDPNDDNIYVLGNIGPHNIVIAALADGETGIAAATQVATHMTRTFKDIEFSLLVGIGGGVPNIKLGRDIRLGDVVVSRPSGESGGVIQYDYGTSNPGVFERKGLLNSRPSILGKVITNLRAEHGLRNGNKMQEYLAPHNTALLPEFAKPDLENAPDNLFRATCLHIDKNATCSKCPADKIIPRRPRTQTGPIIHYGTIGSGNQVIKDGLKRDELAKKDNLICYEMEAAGLMNWFPCVVIRGISDYADSHKNNAWKGYAAATAAAYAKELLGFLPPEAVSPTNLDHGNESRGSLLNPQISTPKLNDGTGSRGYGCFSVFPGRFLSWDEVALGRLVLNLRDPAQHFCPSTIVIDPTEVSVRPFVEIIPMMSYKGNSAFQRLANLISNLFPGKSAESISQRSITYRLINSGTFLSRLAVDESVQKWMEKIYRSKAIYLVVSIDSIVDFAPIGQSNAYDDNEMNARLKARKPFPGDRIVSVQYAKLRFEACRSGKSPVPQLGKTRWRKYFMDVRERNEGLDLLEVGLDEDFHLNSLHDEGLEFQVYSLTSDPAGEKLLFLVSMFLPHDADG